MTAFTLYNYVLSGNCYKVRLMAALLGVSYKTAWDRVDAMNTGEDKVVPRVVEGAHAANILCPNDQVFQSL